MATSPASIFSVPSTVRLLVGVSRRARLWWTRLRHPRARFGERCLVRRRLTLRQSAAARVRFGPGCILDHDLTIECHGELRVGARVIFGHHCTLAARERIEIGDDCMLAELVSVRDHDHAFAPPALSSSPPTPYREQGFECAPVRLGRNVWLGAKVTICKGVTIGDNAVVGANAVVTRDVPPNCVVGGVPARVLKHLPVPSPAHPIPSLSPKIQP